MRQHILDLVKAMQFIIAGRSDDAGPILEQVVREHPDDRIARFVSGIRLLGMGDIDNATAFFNGAMALEQTLPSYYSEKGLQSERNHDFVYDPRFIAAKECQNDEIGSKFGTHGAWTLHVVLWAAEHALALGGDIVQLGVFGGGEAAAIAKYTQFEQKPQHMYLVDTFTGVPEDLWTQDEIRWGASSAQWMYKSAGDLFLRVKDRFRNYPNVEVIQGRVPDILPEVGCDRIGLLLLDMNCAAPERAAVEFFWDSLLPGAVVLADDYGFSSSEPTALQGFYAQKLAFDEFAASKNVPVLSMPTGHGMIIKP